MKGRIDHMALNGDATHLYIAENGNGSVDDVDLNAGKVVGRITGVREPQGIAWLPAQKEIAVASGDGLVTFYRVPDRQKVAVINLKSDADNVRVDRRNGHLIVGYGSGGLAVIDPASHRQVGQMPLPAHPEAFELVGSKVFVNIPDAHEIAIGDIDKGEVTSTVGTDLRFGNFPMTSDPSGARIEVAYREPQTLTVLDTHSLATIFSVPACGDADDLYLHFHQIVLVCGSGDVELVDTSAPNPAVRVATERGARTGLLDLSDNHLFVAVPARNGPAAVWEMTFR